MKKKQACEQKKIGTVMTEYKKGKLTSSGKKVKKRPQAIAIAISVAKKACKK